MQQLITCVKVAVTICCVSVPHEKSTRSALKVSQRRRERMKDRGPDSHGSMAHACCTVVDVEPQSGQRELERRRVYEERLERMALVLERGRED